MTSFDGPTLDESEAMYHSNKKINFEFGLGKHLDLTAKIDDRTGKLLAITDSDGTEMSGTCTMYDVYIDADKLAEVQFLFDSWHVSFSGQAWKTKDQEDFLGYVQFSWDDLNEAIKNKTVVFEQDDATKVWFIPELFDLL